jgi:inhibitor of cysteine peptidase
MHLMAPGTVTRGRVRLLWLLLATASACHHPAVTRIPYPNGPLEIGKGEPLTITLDANPTTGFEWQLAAPLDDKVMKLIGHDFRRSETARVGAGGTDVWTFKAIGTGSTTITLEYRRPWEKDVPPAARKTFPIVVR